QTIPDTAKTEAEYTRDQHRPIIDTCETHRRLPLKSAHLAHDLPFSIADRLHRQPSIFDQRHAFQFYFGFDRRERHRLWHRLAGYGRNRDPWLAFCGRRIRERLADHLANADDLFFIAGMIEEEFVALFHFLEMSARREISHARPGLSLGATLDLIVPGI